MKLAKKELDTATKCFEYADSDDLVDICTLRIAVARKKCDYLIKIAKEQGIVSEILSETNISSAL
ncbi:MAG: hypothetical protein IJQ50_02275 [Clostridia bacterium]|nr:hypothetical protein [Clostridia bacterium]